MNTPLSKMTKAELVAEYEALLAKQKDLEAGAKQVFSEERTKMVETAQKAHTMDTIEKTLNALRGAATGAIGQFGQALEAQVRRFEELQRATALAEERLKVLRELEAGAEVGAQLIGTLESERNALEQEIATKRRDYERAQDEAEYRTKTERRRAEEQAVEEQRKREAVLKEREQATTAKEKELAEALKRLDTFDADLEKEVGKRLADAKKAWDLEHTRELLEKDRERELEEKLHELQMKDLREDVKRLEAECATLRRDAEQANKRAQDLALKIVEGGARERSVPVPSAEK